jgi:hypothetical protein
MMIAGILLLILLVALGCYLHHRYKLKHDPYYRYQIQQELEKRAFEKARREFEGRE